MDATNSTSATAYDQPYRFDRRPTARAPFPFTHREFARLLILRSRIHEAPSQFDQAAMDS